MGVILGTVAGWYRAPEWSSDNRVYTGNGYAMYISPKAMIKQEIIRYKVKFDLYLFFYMSPCGASPVVTRIIQEISINQMFGYPLTDPIPNFERWVDNVTGSEILAQWVDSQVELAGLIPCDPMYRIEIIEREFE